MREAIITAVRNKDIRTKLLYMLLVLVIVRIGSAIPLPWVNRDLLSAWFSSGVGGLDFLDALTGGALSSLTLFALSIAPYITASIIIELLSVAIPRLEELGKDGEEGKKEKERIIRYTGIGLAFLQSAGTVFSLSRRGLFEDITFLKGLVLTFLLTLGCTFLIFLGEWLTKKGIGSGISFILLVNILSKVPGDIKGLVSQFVSGKPLILGTVSSLIILAVILATILFVIYLEGGERHIPVNGTRRLGGSMAASSSTLPLKVNMAGVIPVIFASTILSLPAILMSFFGGEGTGFFGGLTKALSSGNWFRVSEPLYSLGFILYIALLFFFAYFYTSLHFNPKEVAGNLKKSGSVIPGIRPGEPTRQYIETITKRLVLIGATGLAVIATIPLIISGLFNAGVSFLGTSLIIISGVILEIGRGIEGMLKERGRKGFLK